uniref:WYL domain-containing protein n=1 Tax=Ndongobacter massiliensis TaxID=1871025 RepID=UPI000931C33B|nr:WYL domain-containing protein [Ndongobacter massiliensis]
MARPHYSKIERAHRILEYLRQNSDSEHIVTQKSLREDQTMEPYLGDKETYNDTIVKLADALNSNPDGTLKQENEWRLIFDDFKKRYGNEALDQPETDDDDFFNQKMRIRNLHYQHIFTYEEIHRLIESVLFSKTLDTKTADIIINKILKNLTTQFYQNSFQQICRIHEQAYGDIEVLKDNLQTIREAINAKVKISFKFNGFNKYHHLLPVRGDKDCVSPYYIVANGGRYYLLACREGNKEQEKNMSIWRVDLMSEIEIPKKNREAGSTGEPALPKDQVHNLPQSWREDFHYQHLDMAFDKPVSIRLKVKSSKTADGENLRPDYTFLQDRFGNTFRYIAKDRSNPDFDIIRVICSPFAMSNFAMQYSDRVEVLGPDFVREMVIEKIKILKQKYMV